MFVSFIYHRYVLYYDVCLPFTSVSCIISGIPDQILMDITVDYIIHYAWDGIRYMKKYYMWIFCQLWCPAKREMWNDTCFRHMLNAQLPCLRHGDVMWAPSLLNSSAVRLFVQQPAQPDTKGEKIKAPYIWLCKGNSGFGWFPSQTPSYA